MTRPTKRTNGFAYLGHDREELEELCHSFSIAADQRWRTPHGSALLPDIDGTTNSQEALGLQPNTPIHQYNPRPSWLFNKPIPWNPLNPRPGVSGSQSVSVTPTKSGVSLARISLQPSEQRDTQPRRNDAEISYENLLTRLRMAGRYDQAEEEISPYNPGVIFYPPDYEKENMWSLVDFDEITTLDDEVDVEYYSSGNWDLDQEEPTSYSRMSSEHINASSDEEETIHVVSLRGGAGPGAESSDHESSEVEGGESAAEERDESTEVESEVAEEGVETKKEKDIEEGIGDFDQTGKGTNVKRRKVKLPERAKSPRAEAQKSTRDHNIHSPSTFLEQNKGHLEQMTDTQWNEGLEAIEKFVFEQS